jgi:phospholipid-binding lipoprotein MlaA
VTPRTRTRPPRSVVVLVVAALVVASPLHALAQPGPDPFAEDFEDAPPPFPDPLEPINRQVMRANGWIELWILDPLATAFGWTPAFMRNSVRRFFSNLEGPGGAINDGLKGNPDGATVAGYRFILNSTIGVLGFLDPAAYLGMPAHDADFGQTLALYGVPSGPYLVLPMLGPSNARDGFGFVVDLAFNPATYVFFFVPIVQIVLPALQGPTTHLLILPTMTGGTAGVAMWEAERRNLRILRESSVDFYAALRSAYTQARTAQIFLAEDPKPSPRFSPPGGRRFCPPGQQSARRGRLAGGWRCTLSAAAPSR